MSARLRRFLLVFGLLLLLSGLFAIGFALWPRPDAHMIATLPPTLFAPP
jgi:hypothetical protein